MKSKIYPRCILLLVGALLWVMYLCQHAMARYGIYTVFSYSVHQILSAVPYLGVVGAVVWLAAVLIRGRRAYDWKIRLPFAILLALLLLWQIVYLVGQSQLRTMTIATTVVSSDPLKEELVIRGADGQVTLECPKLVQNMVELEDQAYMVTYEYRSGNPNEGTLCMIERVK